MNAKAKGNGYEREAKLLLEAKGWSVFRCHRKPIFINGKMLTMGADIFGCDIVAKKLGYKTRWIQVSTVENKSKKVKQVEEFCWTLDHEDVELWLRVKGKKAFRTFVLTAKQVGAVENESGVGIIMGREFVEGQIETNREAV